MRQNDGFRDLERVERIGEFWSYPQSRAFPELLIDCKEDRCGAGGAGQDAWRWNGSSDGHVFLLRRG